MFRFFLFYKTVVSRHLTLTAYHGYMCYMCTHLSVNCGYKMSWDFEKGFSSIHPFDLQPRVLQQVHNYLLHWILSINCSTTNQHSDVLFAYTDLYHNNVYQKLTDQLTISLNYYCSSMASTHAISIHISYINTYINLHQSISISSKIYCITSDCRCLGFNLLNSPLYYSE